MTMIESSLRKGKKSHDPAESTKQGNVFIPVLCGHPFLIPWEEEIK